MQKVVTIFLGAGFSKIGGFPLVSEVNQNFVEFLDTKNVYRYTSSEWSFKAGEPGFFNEVVQGILKIYKEKTKESFDYESSLSWILKNRSLWSEDSYFEKYEKRKADLNEVFTNIKFVFVHLIKSVIDRAVKEAMVMKYQFFIEYLIERFLLQGRTINIFSLNHDILVEKILNYYGYEFADGFSITNSPLYHQSKQIQIYNFAYDKNINLYKLHGSFNYYNIELRIPNSNFSPSYVQGTNYYLKAKISQYLDKHRAHIKNVKLNPVSNQFNLDIEPNFITGLNKKQLIQQDYVYNDLLRRFNISYIMSDLVVVMGYSYRDEHVNNIMDLYGMNSKMDLINMNPGMEYALDTSNKNLNVVNIKNPNEFGYQLQQLDERD